MATATTVSFEYDVTTDDNADWLTIRQATYVGRSKGTRKLTGVADVVTYRRRSVPAAVADILGWLEVRGEEEVVIGGGVKVDRVTAAEIAAKLASAMV